MEYIVGFAVLGSCKGRGLHLGLLQGPQPPAMLSFSPVVVFLNFVLTSVSRRLFGRLYAINVVLEKCGLIFPSIGEVPVSVCYFSNKCSVWVKCRYQGYAINRYPFSGLQTLFLCQRENFQHFCQHPLCFVAAGDKNCEYSIILCLSVSVDEHILLSLNAWSYCMLCFRWGG